MPDGSKKKTGDTGTTDGGTDYEIVATMRGKVIIVNEAGKMATVPVAKLVNAPEEIEDAVIVEEDNDLLVPDDDGADLPEDYLLDELMVLGGKVKKQLSVTAVVDILKSAGTNIKRISDIQVSMRDQVKAAFEKALADV